MTAETAERRPGQGGAPNDALGGGNVDVIVTQQDHRDRAGAQ